MTLHLTYDSFTCFLKRKFPMCEKYSEWLKSAGISWGFVIHCKWDFPSQILIVLRKTLSISEHVATFNELGKNWGVLSSEECIVMLPWKLFSLICIQKTMPLGKKGNTAHTSNLFWLITISFVLWWELGYGNLQS